MRVMNELFRPYIEKLVVVYFDDILIYSPDRMTHLQQLRHVLGLLQEARFFAAKAKCSFITDSVLFLGYVMASLWTSLRLRLLAVGQSLSTFMTCAVSMG